MLRRGRALPILIELPRPLMIHRRLSGLRSDDVAAFAVLIEDKSDVGGAVRIVFETLNNSGNTVFIALEVDDTVGLLVAAALMTNSDTAEVVTTGSAVLLFYEGCKRFAFVQFRVHNLNGVTTTRQM